ncbi:MAG: RNA polymerase sigma-70 factor [Actinomycetota bacterium]
MTETKAPEHWRYLFAIAYRMLGTVHEAEDAVQEAYVRFAEAAPEDVRSARAYLSTLVTRISIDRLRSAARKRETYVGPWLPEPIVADGDPAEAADPDSLSLAFLVVLESLNPVERAVFLLREVFGYEHEQIARVVERSEVNVRQIAHRAREAVAARRPRFDIAPDKKREIGERFLDALRRLDIPEMLTLLDDEVTLRSDGGGVVQAARRPIVGPDKVTRFLVGISSVEFDAVEVALNGQPGMVVKVGGQVVAAVSIDLRDDRIRDIFIIVNPEKLAAIREEV